MSVTLVLVPLAIAAVGAINVHRQKVRQGTMSAFRLSTRMKDGDLIENSLKNCGAGSDSRGDDAIGAPLGDSRVVFQRGEQGAFDAVFIGAIGTEEAQKFLFELDEEYALLVQQQTYRKLLARARERGLVVESEEVYEDNSMVMTLRVEEVQGS